MFHKPQLLLGRLITSQGNLVSFLFDKNYKETLEI